MAKQQARVNRKLKERHRAHKKDSLPAKPIGEGRDARKRAARKPMNDALYDRYKSYMDDVHEVALAIDAEFNAEFISASELIPVEEPAQ